MASTHVLDGTGPRIRELWVMYGGYLANQRTPPFIEYHGHCPSCPLTFFRPSGLCCHLRILSISNPHLYKVMVLWATIIPTFTMEANVESLLNWPRLVEHDLPPNGGTLVADLLSKPHLHGSGMR